MFEQRLQEVVDSVAAEYDQLAGSAIPEARNTSVTVHLVYNSSIDSFGDRLPPIIFDQLDWESENRMRERLKAHVDAYFAERAKV